MVKHGNYLKPALLWMMLLCVVISTRQCSANTVTLDIPSSNTTATIDGILHSEEWNDSYHIQYSSR